MKQLAQQLAQIRKFLVAAAGAVGVVVTAKVLHGQAQHYAVAISAGLGALLVYVVPNAQRAVDLIQATGPSLIAELKQVVTHPDVMSQILSTVKDELRRQAAQSNAPVAKQPTNSSTWLTAPAAPVQELPPLIPPDVPQEAPAAVQAVAETPGPVPAV